MNLPRQIATLLESNGFGTFGIDIFIGGADYGTPDKCLWITLAGGANAIEPITGEKLKDYIVTIYARGVGTESVYETIESIEAFFNSKDCIEISGYTLIDISTLSFPVDSDLDSEDRKIGTLEVRVSIHTNN